MGKLFLSVLTSRVRAGMLSLVLVISLVIAAISASLISAAYYFRILNFNLDTQGKLARNAHSAAQYLLSVYPQLLPDRVILDLFNEGTDSVELSMEQWGAFRIGYCKAFFRRESAGLCFMIGVKPSLVSQSALYLADDNRPLQMAGRAMVKGGAYLPKAGVKKASIRGKPYLAGQLIAGNVQESEAQLPLLEPAVRQYVSSLALADPSAYDSLIRAENVVHSFFAARALHLYNSEPVVITKTLRGKIIVQSDQRIFVDAGARLENVILVAPKILIASDFKGTLQAFATDTLIVGHHAQLSFPSVLAVAGNSSAFIEIHAGVKVEGAVLCFNPLNGAAGMVKIHENAMVTGQVYVNGALQHEGDIKGNVMCRKFISDLPSGIFENHLVDATIDSELITTTDFFGVPVGSAGDDIAGILKWLK